MSFEGESLKPEIAKRAVPDIDAAVEMACVLLGVEPTGLAATAKEFPEIEAFYVWEQTRGGRSLIIGYDATFLFAQSSVVPSAHRQSYADGQRTNLEELTFSPQADLEG